MFQGISPLERVETSEAQQGGAMERMVRTLFRVRRGLLPRHERLLEISVLIRNQTRCRHSGNEQLRTPSWSFRVAVLSAQTPHRRRYSSQESNHIHPQRGWICRVVESQLHIHAGTGSATGRSHVAVHYDTLEAREKLPKLAPS